MTTSQWIQIRRALLSAALLAESDIQRAKNTDQTRFYKQIALRIDQGMRSLDAIEGERSDLPQLQQQAIALAAEIRESSSSQEVA